MEDVSNFFTDIRLVMSDSDTNEICNLLGKYNKYDMLNRMHVLFYYLQEDYKKIKNKDTLEIMTTLARIINECEGRKLYIFTVDELVKLGDFVSKDIIVMNAVTHAYAKLLNDHGVVPFDCDERYDLVTTVYHAFVKDEEFEVFYEINPDDNGNHRNRDYEDY